MTLEKLKEVLKHYGIKSEEIINPNGDILFRLSKLGYAVKVVFGADELKESVDPESLIHSVIKTEIVRLLAKVQEVEYRG